MAVPDPELPWQLATSQRKAIDAYRHAGAVAEAEMREAQIRWQAILCTCRPAWRPMRADHPPDHARCVIHGHMVLTWDGRWL
jgi:hypothetical protein